MAYAVDTEVPVEKSRAQIEAMLSKAGADSFGYMNRDGKALLMFRLGGKNIMFDVPLPDKNAKKYTHYQNGHGGWTARTTVAAYKIWEQACKSRWRALALCIKAKLEAVEVGIATFEEEFLAHVVLASGKTIGQEIIPRLDKIQGGAPMLTWEK